MMQTVLVTGATGFIGQHLCPELLRVGYRVRGTCRELPRAESPAGMEWELIPHIGPTTSWKRALQGVDYVVHLAGVAHRVRSNDVDLGNEFQRVNVEGTQRLADSIRQQSTPPRRLIFISSIKAQPCASPDGLLGIGDSAYGRSKFAAEQSLAKILEGSRTDFCILRPCVVYGPGNLGNMARLLRMINLGVPLPFASIHNRKSLLFVGNLVSAIIQVLAHPAASRGTFTLSDPEILSTPELIKALSIYSGRKIRLFSLPVGFLRSVARLGDWVQALTGFSVGWNSYSVDRLCNSLVIDPSAFYNALQWSPPYSAQEGFRLTVAGPKEQNAD